METKNVKPVIKWVGGKTTSLEYLMGSFPYEVNDYYEPFLGGGSVLLEYLYHIKDGLRIIKGKITASDSNEALIYMYKNIQNNKDILYKELLKLEDNYKNILIDKEVIPRKKNKQQNNDPKSSRENYYYYIRDLYNQEKNKKNIKSSAMFIFLNKTGFRGLYRTSQNGFNVPFGNYKNPTIADKINLNNVSNLIQNVNFVCDDYKNILKTVKPNDFVYLDPPYYPIGEQSFVGYNKEGFSSEEHNKLFNLCRDLHTKKVRFALNNADVQYIKDLFNDKKVYYIEETPEVKRAINIKNPESTIGEILITNHI